MSEMEKKSEERKHLASPFATHSSTSSVSPSVSPGPDETKNPNADLLNNIHSLDDSENNVSPHTSPNNNNNPNNTSNSSNLLTVPNNNNNNQRRPSLANSLFGDGSDVKQHLELEVKLDDLREPLSRSEVDIPEGELELLREPMSRAEIEDFMEQNQPYNFLPCMYTFPCILLFHRIHRSLLQTCPSSFGIILLWKGLSALFSAS
jgi:hypothetical protein